MSLPSLVQTYQSMSMTCLHLSMDTTSAKLKTTGFSDDQPSSEFQSARNELLNQVMEVAGTLAQGEEVAAVDGHGAVRRLSVDYRVGLGMTNYDSGYWLA